MKFTVQTFWAIMLLVEYLVSDYPFAPPASSPKQQISKHLRPIIEKRATPQFASGQPIDGGGKGAPFGGKYFEFSHLHSPSPSAKSIQDGTNHPLDLQNPDNLGQQSTDSGLVPNLKWSFSDSKTRLLPGGFVREQTITDLPSSTDISAVQLHLTKNAIRELHWHSVVCERRS